MSIFKTSSFDTFVTKGVELSDNKLVLPLGETTVLDCQIRNFGDITAQPLGASPAPVDMKTTVKFGGSVEVERVTVPNVVIIGDLKCRELHVEGTLSVHGSAKVEADVIRYRSLNIQAGAVILAKMEHLDYTSAGEQT